MPNSKCQMVTIEHPSVNGTLLLHPTGRVRHLTFVV